jgi:hypothetical protein
MACPYFCPTQRLEGPAWRSKIRPPLGDVYAGECQARPEQSHVPDRDVLEVCNLGYAARQCPRFPASGGPEAVRFCVQDDQGGIVSIRYVLERAHLPFEHGCLLYDRARKDWAEPRAGALLQRQAQAYLESYLNWKEGKSP